METFIVKGEVFSRMRKALGDNFSRKMTSEFGAVAVNFSKERFVKKNWKNQVLEPWKPRKRPDRGSLMVRTGRLKRSVRKMGSGVDYVIIGSDVPYARVHNEGGKSNKSVYVRAHTRKKTVPKSVNLRTRKPSRKRVDIGQNIKVKSHTRKMNLNLPRRQFLGPSRALEIRLQRHLKLTIERTITKKL
ncbi:phage virion morphogenesis protein [Riemerella anatipestifer]|uniref:Phage virion morphogenesis protein n=1 Tax=Riemerella anatipestifer TaxID=34085 RepID=A0A1S7DV93_RIEAN|nr:phage virion morphogenesis protein [Riemerella anatipestifer]AQY22988.1 hypothetical protein AB406_2048 [Riemerella anatipestifer]